MNIKLLKIIIVLIILIVPSVLLFIYLNKEYTIDVPLKEGRTYIFNGKYIIKSSQKPIKFNAPEHRIVIERTFKGRDGEMKYLTALYIGSERTYAAILEKNKDGLILVMGQRRILLIPSKVKIGQKWDYKFGNEKITMRAGGNKKFNIGSTTYYGREITFQSENRTRIKIWINNKIGITAIKYSYLETGPSRQEAELTRTAE